MKQFDAAAYSIVVAKVHEDGEDLYFAYVKEIPDISSYSESFQEAYDDCIDSLNILHTDAMEHGKTFPSPYRAHSPAAPSGRVTLRMSRSMHADVARCADEDGISLNQWIVEAISQRRGFYVSSKPSVATALISSSILAPVLNMLTSSSAGQLSDAGRELKLSSTDESRYISVT